MTMSTILRPWALKNDLLDEALRKMYTKYVAKLSRSGSRGHVHPVEHVLRFPLPTKRQILHQLLCIDSDFPYDGDTVAAVEAFLEFERGQIAPESFIDSKEGKAYEVFPNPERDWQSVSAWKGNMLNILGDEKWAIVNPANDQLLGCFQPEHRCLDNQIHTAAGPRLRQECAEEIGRRGGPPPAGTPIITGAGLLPFGYVIHVAGPSLERRRAATQEEQGRLRDAYRDSLTLASENGVVTIAFPCISTGLFNFPSQQAASVATRAVADWFNEHRETPMRVIFMLWTDNDIACYRSAVTQTFPDTPNFNVRICNTIPDTDIFKNVGGLIIHTGAGLSADAVSPDLGLGLDYTSRELFQRLYPGIVQRTPIRTLYGTIGYEWDDPLEQWGFILAHAHRVLNWGETAVYNDLLRLLDILNVPYTIMTSNADQLFFQSGFDAERVFTPQGCYARFQCLEPCAPDAYFDSKPWIEQAVPYLDLSDPIVPKGKEDLIPRCPKCGGEVFLNVRGGDWFLETPYEDAEQRYRASVQEMTQSAEAEGKRVIVLELGSGFNTPTVIRYPSEALAESEAVSLLRVNKEHPEIHSQIDGARGYKMGAGEFLHSVVAHLDQRASP